MSPASSSSPLFVKTQQQKEPSRQQEYISAQRAAAEAIQIGRETLQTAVQQGEQLEHADRLADETGYTLQKATRVLRGMTWSGWVANKFSTLQPLAKDDTASTNNTAVGVYARVPKLLEPAAQAIQNYQANLMVLEACQELDQFETCQTVCDQMHQRICQEFQKLQQNDVIVDVHVLQKMLNDVSVLRKRQQDYSRPWNQQQQAVKSASTDLFGTTTTPKQKKETPIICQQQEDHLKSISQSLGELHSIGNNLGIAMEHQTDVIQSLEQKTEDNIETSKMNTRRADRLVQSTAYNRVKKEFYGNVSILHLESGLYLSVTTNGGVELTRDFTEACEFGLWKRQGRIFGLQNRYSRTWLGQTFWGGSLACNALHFEKRQEWEANIDTKEDEELQWKDTKLLCASAGFGAGGYLMVNAQRVISIGGGDALSKQKASRWCISKLEG